MCVRCKNLTLKNSKFCKMLNNLNQSQHDAVTSTEGPLLVLAGAGTGKTKVLTSRIVYILENGLAQAHEILAVTFTNKAALEMKNRIYEHINNDVDNLWVGTFHAIGAKILRRHGEIVGLRSDFTILDDDDQTRLIKQILSDLNIDREQFPAKNYLNKISRLKDSGKTFKNSIAFEFDDVNLPKFNEVFKNYQIRLKAMNATDFGDLLNTNLEIFSLDPEVLTKYQNQFRYILVDEYQDTNDTQYQWLLKLAKLYQNICCVGDDDQSIYSWRGANIANILRFEKDYGDAKVIRLEQNYRSTSRILRVAHAVISNNQQRHGKKLWSQLGEGEKIQLKSFHDDRSESFKTATIIKNYLNNGANPSQIAILVRAGYQTRQFEEALMQNAINYNVVGGLKFYERMEIRDSIAYLRLCSNLSDDLALMRIINTPKRGVGDSALNSIQNVARTSNISFFQAIKLLIEQNLLKGKAKESLSIFVNNIDKNHLNIDKSDLQTIARQILESSGYIDNWRKENTLEAQGRVENIEEFIKSLNDFSNMTEFLEYASLVEVRDAKSTLNAVNIMTIHAAKGLEFDNVFLPGLEEGIFPSNKAMENNNAIEEERRLMYVAITRAKKRLVMSYAKTRFVFGDVQKSSPSRFIKELPQDEIEVEEINNYGYGNFFNNNSYEKKSKYDDNSSYKTSYSKNNESSEINYKPRKLVNNLNSFIQGSVALAPLESKNSEVMIDDKRAVSDIGARVFHQKFGYGRVENIDGNRYTINFEKTGIKTVIKSFISFV